MSRRRICLSVLYAVNLSTSSALVLSSHKHKRSTLILSSHQENLAVFTRPSDSAQLLKDHSPVREDSELDQLPKPTPNLEPPFIGIRRDFLNRFPQYGSDIRDGVNPQAVATILYLTLAVLAPTIGFGGVLGEATGQSMGVIETIAGTSMSGVLYGLFSAQPVQIIGVQGPVIAYILALYQLAKVTNLPFLPLYACTGLWTSAFLACFAISSASNIVQHLTRWTDEIFSVLVSFIFLSQAIGDVSKTFTVAGPANTALLTLVTSSLTFGTAMVLKTLNTTRYFTKSIRKNLSNFAPAIGVFVGAIAARAARTNWQIVLPALSLPSQLVTSSGRPWIVSGLTQANVWLMALPAGMAAAILLYLDQNITARLVNHPRYKQVKGKRTSVLDGMHLDLLVLSVVTAISSLFGLPWMCGAPTRSAAHVRALAIVDEKGETQGTVENRVTGTTVHALVGLCAVAALPRQLIAQVPKPVLSGIFLYLGFTSLQGAELWDRIRCLFKDKVVEPFNKAGRREMNRYTFAQLSSLFAMMAATQSKFGVVSPLLIALLPVVRWGLIKARVVSKDSVDVMDS